MALLAAERVALNFAQRLSGVATLTAKFVAETKGTRAAILDTRKTTPGLRVFEKYAVLCGGGRNHRMGLYDAVLIKDNHIRLCGSPAEAVLRARAHAPGKLIEVEVDTLAQLKDALGALPDIILLDNMPTSHLKQALALMRGFGRKRILSEVSGGIRLKDVARIARLGVDHISVGALTHSAPASDLSLEFLDPEKFHAALKTRSFGRNLHAHALIDSSNRLLKDLAGQGAEEGTLVCADEQSAGRGRWGRVWESPAGQGLLFSLPWWPPGSMRRSQLTAVLGGGLARRAGLRPEARLKWPNGFVSGRKLSGLLLESDGAALIAGMGLNVNQEAGDFAPGLNAVSLRQCASKALERESLLAALLLEMEGLYAQWQQDGFEPIRSEWDEKACFIGEMVRAGELQGRVLAWTRTEPCTWKPSAASKF